MYNGLCLWRLLVFAFILTQIPIFPAHAQGNMPCLSGVINQYTPVLGFGCDSSTLQVGTTSGFSAGDEVLLIQMQVPQVDLSNTPSFGNLLNNCCVGNYEVNRVLSINGATVQLQYALSRTYDLSGKIQLVKVPEFDSVMVCGITCMAWNGTVGGVLALDVKTKLILNGDIDVSRKGFRGGRVEPLDIPWVFGEQQFFYPPQSTLAAEKGEGIVQIPADHSYGRGRAANGGGGGNAHNGGGGGGANGGDAGNGGLEITNLPAAPTPNTDGIGGQSYFSNQADRLIMGGGGGAGHANDTRGTSGGAGGGIVWLSAPLVLANNHRIIANGEDIFGGPEQNDGQGGGGGGGTILLETSQVNGLLYCDLKGGEGGSNPYTPNYQLHGPGGGGGGGKFLSTVNLPSLISDLQGGPNGFTSQHLTNGAQPGAWGKALYGISVTKDVLPAHPVSSAMQLSALSPSCNGDFDGIVAVLHSTALAFSLNGGPWQSDSVFAGLGAGTYHIALQFSGGCTLDTVAQLSAPPPVQDSLIALVHADCLTGGKLQVTASGGIAPYVFSLDAGPGQNSGVFSGILPGMHQLQVQDSKGCAHTSAYTILGPPPVLDSLIAVDEATCLQGGKLDWTAVSGTAPFEYQIDMGVWQPSGTFSGLTDGLHNGVIRDAAGCLFLRSFTISTAPFPADTLLSLVNATCIAGGAVTITALNGVPPFEYNLDGGAWQPNGNFTGLTPGLHQFGLRDANGCLHFSNQNIAAAPPVSLQLIHLENATCVQNGALELNVSGGTGPFEYRLDNGAWQTSGQFPALPAGQYHLTLRDAAGCLDSSLYTIAPAPPVQLILSGLSSATCVAGGMLELQADAGTAPFVFSINGSAWTASGLFQNLNAGPYEVVVQDISGCRDTAIYQIPAPPPAQLHLNGLVPATCLHGGTLSAQAISGTAPYLFQVDANPGQGSGNFQEIPVGAHLLWLTDAAGCTDSSHFTINPPPLVLDTLLELYPATCTHGGLLWARASSGLHPFEYQLDNGTWQPQETFANLPAGPYLLRIRDANGCLDSSLYVIDAPELPRDSLLALSGATCVAGGILSITGLGPAAPFEYRLNTGNWQPNGNFLNLSPGAYQVFLRDTSGCLDTSSYLITAPPTLGDSVLSLKNATCVNGGILQVGGVGGTQPFVYQLDGGPWQASGLFSGLAAGLHVFSIRDSMGCLSQGQGVIAAPPPLLDTLLWLKPAGCVEGGSLSLQVVSGTPPYAFQLGSGAAQSGGLFSDLAPGIYTVSLTDAAYCKYQSQYNIPAPPLPVLQLDSIQRVDCRHESGFIGVSGFGGTAPLSFVLEPGHLVQTNGQFTSLESGIYAVTLRDSAGCEAHLNQLQVPSKIDSFFTSETVTIYEGKSFRLPDGRVVSHSGQFLFEYESQEGCDSLHLIEVQVLKRHIYIPNAIRPDDEGRNDYFTVFGDASLEKVERLSIYDRWGELLFDKQDFIPNVESEGWDGFFRGRPVNPGVFVWTLRLRFTDGLVLDYSGNLSVLR